MVTIGVRELKEQASQILRRVREDGEIFEVTYHGEAIARLIPLVPPPPQMEMIAAVLADMNQLAAEISLQWPAGVSALDAIHDVRREL